MTFVDVGLSCTKVGRPQMTLVVKSTVPSLEVRADEGERDVGSTPLRTQRT